jgi:nucleotide-binding universal stress UspA family protein
LFEHIVAAIDDDTIRRGRVIDATREIAAALKSTVVVAHVRELERPGPTTGRPTTLVSSAAAAAPIMLEDAALARALVDEAVRTLAKDGVDATGVVREGGGQTARELLELAEENDADLIVVGDRGVHVTDLLLGSVAHRIVHGAPCPVLLIR